MTDNYNTDPESQLAALRRQAQELGFDSDPADTPSDLETADAFIARMKTSDPGATAELTHHRDRRRWLITAGIAAAAAAVAIAVVIQPGGAPVEADTPPVLDYEFSSAVRIAYAPGEPADPTLAALASAASAVPDASGTGPIQHHITDNWYTDQDDAGNAVITPRVTETWLNPDGSSTTRDTIGQQLDSNGRGIPTDAPTYPSDPATERLPAGSIDATFANQLSTDPDTLRTQLLDHASCTQKNNRSSERTFCLYTEIVGLYSTYVVTPELGQAVWTMLQGETGLTSLGSVEDRAGRNGTGISLIPDQRPTNRFVLIASTETGQLLGTEEILTKTDPDLDVEPPSVLSFTTIVTADRTNTTP